MKLKLLLCSAILLAVGGSAFATTTVTGTLQNLGTGTVGQGAFVRFWLRGCGGNQPRVNGTAVIAPSQGGVFYFDFVANASGNVNGTLYSTRDVTGLLGGDITCGTSTTSVWYGMQVFVGGKGGPEIPVHALNTATLNISSVTPITVTPVITAPTGDSTYLRKDAGNSPVTGPLAINNSLTVSGAGTFTNPCTLGGFIYVSTGGCYTTIPQAIAAFAGGNCGTIYLPVGTFTTNFTINSSNACANSSSQMIIQGSGRRSTILKPASNAPVITLDSTAAAIQGVAIRDVGFDNTATGFTQPAILIQGTNINDWHDFRRLRISGGFNGGITVTGRTIWSVFDQISIESDAGIALNLTPGNNPFNFNSFRWISVTSAAGAEGVLLTCTTLCIDNYFDGLDVENGAGIGAVFNNTQSTRLRNEYFETNAGIQISFTGTFARALSIEGGYVNTPNNTVDISVTATQSSGEIAANFISNSGGGAATVNVTGSTTGNGVFVHGNWEIGPHAFQADGNSNYHAFSYGAYAPVTLTTTGSQTPSVFGINNIRYANTSPATITNFTGGDPGQELRVFNEGTSTVTFTHANTNAPFMINGQSVTISNGQACSFFLEAINSRWVEIGCTNGSFATLTGTETLTNKTLNVPLASGTGLQIFNTTTTCTTAATAFATCTTAAISLPVAEADTSYRLVCTPHGPTNFPILVGTTISSATQFTITIEATTAAAATFASYDCIAGHN